MKLRVRCEDVRQSGEYFFATNPPSLRIHTRSKKPRPRRVSQLRLPPPPSLGVGALRASRIAPGTVFRVALQRRTWGTTRHSRSELATPMNTSRGHTTSSVQIIHPTGREARRRLANLDLDVMHRSETLAPLYDCLKRKGHTFVDVFFASAECEVGH